MRRGLLQAQQQAVELVTAAGRITAQTLPNPSISYGGSRLVQGLSTGAVTQHEVVVEQPLLLFHKREARLATADAEVHVEEARVAAALAVVGAGVHVGPFAHLRPGTRLAAESRVGSFVETKNAVVGEGAKLPHLAYVGDAEVGAGANVGAGTITANYDEIGRAHV